MCCQQAICSHVIYKTGKSARIKNSVHFGLAVFYALSNDNICIQILDYRNGAAFNVKKLCEYFVKISHAHSILCEMFVAPSMGVPCLCPN